MQFDFFFKANCFGTTFKKKLLKSYKYIAATTDMWSRHNMSFIAVTVHCSNPETLEPHSYFLCCEYFPGHHTKLSVAQKLQNIFVKYAVFGKDSLSQ